MSAGVARIIARSRKRRRVGRGTGRKGRGVERWRRWAGKEKKKEAKKEEGKKKAAR